MHQGPCRPAHVASRIERLQESVARELGFQLIGHRLELFGLPLVLGDPEGHLVLATYLYKLTNKLGTPSYHLMAAVAVCIVAVTFPLVLLQRWLLKTAGKYVSVKGKATRQKLLPPPALVTITW